ncbi:MAG TPA: ABC transporter substrate-binding protein, partial [Thermomicrobiales bacterium]|nr:ABC transporter substrate-binding protein [Thermomicrobiales bacterium]
MSDSAPTGKFSALYEQLQAGKLSRREFTFRALALGVGLPVISFVLRAETVRATGATSHVGWGVAAAQGAAARPAVGMEGKKRGEGGELKLIQWQAPTVLSPHVSTGTKDYLASSIVLEPLMNYLPDGTLIPNLVTEVPTVDNGMLKKDLSGVTFKLLDGVTWSDGEPFTADDVVYTWQWIMNPAN